MRGHVRKRGKTWSAVVFVGYGDDGKKKYKWFGGHKSEKEAQKFLTKILAEIDRGTYREQSRDTVAHYMQEWLAYKETQVRIRTFETIESRVRNYVVPALGHYAMGDLQPKQLQRFYMHLSDILSERTVLHIHRLLHDALGRAVKWQIIATNPAEAVEPPKAKRAEITIWSVDEVVAFLREAQQNRWYVFFLLAVTAGMRRGEILGLEWDDIDFDKKRLHVQRTMQFSHTSEDRYVIEDPKTFKSRRIITLTDDAVLSLRKHRARVVEERLQGGSEYHESRYVVVNENGTSPNPGSLRRVFRQLCERANVPPIRIHDLRHTHASLMLEAGVNVKVISERLGHSNIGTTMDIYTHVLPSLQESAAMQFGELLSGQKKKKDDDPSSSATGL